MAQFAVLILALAAFTSTYGLAINPASHMVSKRDANDGSYYIRAGPDGEDGTYHGESHDLGTDDGSYKPDQPEGDDGSYRALRGEDGEDGTYHEEATHNAGVLESQYHEGYNPIHLVPVPIAPVAPQNYIAPYSYFPHGYVAPQHAGFPYYPFGYSHPHPYTYSHPYTYATHPINYLRY